MKIEIVAPRMRTLHCIIAFIMAFNLSAQYSPSNCTLNFSQVLFKYPYNQKAIVYQITIYPDTTNAEFLNQNKILVIDSTPATIVNNLRFSNKYKWFVKSFDINKDLVDSSDVFTFNISYCKQADTNFYKYKNTYFNVNDTKLFSLDHSHCIINRKGEVVWFLPQTQYDFKEGKQIRCINLLENGNLTLLSERNIYEIGLDGKIVWQGPNDGKISRDTIEHYHHYFKKLENGNYITLSQDLRRKRVYQNETHIIENGTIIEYDNLKNIVWSYSSYSKKLDSLIFVYGIKTGNPFLSSHINSIAFSNDNKFIYLSFRNISRIIKVEKKTKKIVAEYGEKLSDNDWVKESNDFKYQHDVCILESNTIMVFNNGLPKKEIPSEVVIVKENKLKPELIKLQTLPLKIDTINDGKSLRAGSVKKLNQTNLLVNVSNRLIEFKNTKPIWDMLLLYKRSGASNFEAKPQYNVTAYSSLYPYFFTANISTSNNELLLTINNEGSENDAYEVELKNLETNTIKTLIKDIYIDSNKTSKSKISKTQLIKGKVTLIVTSKKSKQTARLRLF